MDIERLALAADAPLPTKVGMGDIAAVRSLTAQFRTLGRAGQAGMGRAHHDLGR